MFKILKGKINKVLYSVGFMAISIPYTHQYNSVTRWLYQMKIPSDSTGSLSIVKALASKTTPTKTSPPSATSPSAVSVSLSEEAKALLQQALANGKKMSPMEASLRAAVSPNKTLTSATVGPSYWKEPVPKNATLENPGFKASYFQSDTNYFVVVDNNTPTVDLLIPAGWGDRDGSSIPGHQPQKIGSVKIPANFVIPDVIPPDTPNNPTVIYNKDTGKSTTLNGLIRPVAGGPVYAFPASGSHAGSGLTGGEITQAELNQGKIEHGLAINIQASKYVSFNQGGFTYPATTADGYASPQTYGGSNPNVVMGARLVIPPDVKPADLGITSKDGLAIFNSLQKYGALVADDSGWDAFGFAVDIQAVDRLETIRPELHKMYQSLQVVVKKPTT
jgi:hypothetical protein